MEKTIWKTLTGKFDVFHHLVQSTKNIIPDPEALRTIVMDETAWRQLAYYCYIDKHGNAVRKKLKKDKEEHISLKEVRVHLSKRKNVNQRFPDRNLIRRWGRQVQWNLEYWMNGPRYKPGASNFPDPFLKVGDESYYGYERDPHTGKLRFTIQVTTKIRKVDEIYSQHFMRPPSNNSVQRKKRRKLEPPSEDTLDQLEETAKDLFK